MKKAFFTNLLAALSIVPSLHGTITQFLKSLADTHAALTYVYYMERNYGTKTMGDLLDYKNRDGRNVIDRLYDENIITSGLGPYLHLMWDCAEHQGILLRDWKGNPRCPKDGIFLQLKDDLIKLLADKEKSAVVRAPFILKKDDSDALQREAFYANRGYNIGYPSQWHLASTYRNATECCRQENVVDTRKYAALTYVYYMEVNYETKTMGDLLDHTDREGKNIVDRLYAEELVSTTGGTFLNLMEGCTEHREVPLKDWKKDPASGEGIFRKLEKRMVEIIDPGLTNTLDLWSPELMQSMKEILQKKDDEDFLGTSEKRIYLRKCGSTPPFRRWNYVQERIASPHSEDNLGYPINKEEPFKKLRASF